MVYTGTPGSSKTLHAVHDIWYVLTKPRGADVPVICNFPLNLDGIPRRDAFTLVDNEDLTPDYLVQFADDFWAESGLPFREDYILLVIDECQILYNSRLWQSKGRRGKNDSRLDWLEFFSQHRKYGYKIILIAQSAKMIDNQFRMLVDTEVNHRAIKHMGRVGAVFGLLPRPCFLWVRYLFQSGERLGMRMYVARARDMRLYDTYGRLRKVS